MIFINSVPVYNNAAKVNGGDIISVRHYGKFKVNDIGGLSKKGKIKIEYLIYN